MSALAFEMALNASEQAEFNELSALVSARSSIGPWTREEVAVLALREGIRSALTMYRQIAQDDAKASEPIAVEVPAHEQDDAHAIARRHRGTVEHADGDRLVLTAPAATRAALVSDLNARGWATAGVA